MNNITLSLCMIVRDEEKVIGRCLSSVEDLFDEIIIVDTGSIDKTKEIVKKYTDKIYDFKWIHDFSAARNFSFSKATSDFIMWLDADDVIYKEELEKLKEFKRNLDLNIQGYRMKYNYIQDKQDHAIIEQQRIRVLRNNHKYKWVGKIHEVIVMEEQIPSLDIVIHHKKEEVLDPDRNINIYRTMEKNKEHFPTRDLFLYGLELSGHKEYEKAIKTLNKMFRRKKDFVSQKYYYDQALLTKLKVYKQTKRSLEEQKKLLLQYLKDFSPSAALCCELGNIFNSEGNIYPAKFWFETALKIAEKHPEDHVEYNEFCPYYGLAYFYYCVGDLKTALDFSNKALSIYPMNIPAQKNHEMYYNEFLKRKREILHEKY